MPGPFPYSPTGQACSCSMAPFCSLNKPSALEATPVLPISCAQLPWSPPPSPLHTHTCAPQFTTLCGSHDPPYPSRMQLKRAFEPFYRVTSNPTVQRTGGAPTCLIFFFFYSILANVEESKQESSGVRFISCSSCGFGVLPFLSPISPSLEGD